MSEARECLVKETGGLVNDLVNDTISRNAAIDAVSKACEECRGTFARCEEYLLALPSAGSEIVRCKD